MIAEAIEWIREDPERTAKVILGIIIALIMIPIFFRIIMTFVRSMN